MPSVYSTLFYGALASSAGTTVAYTVPVGKVAILRDADIVAAGAGAGVFLQEGTTPVTFYFTGAPTGFQWYEWRGRQVFDAGMTIVVGRFDAQTYGVRLSGYLLDA